MSGQPIPVGAQAAPDPGPIFETATGFMRAKHLFMAGELGVFEVLADGGKSLDQLARDLGLPRRTARPLADAGGFGPPGPRRVGRIQLHTGRAEDLF